MRKKRVAKVLRSGKNSNKIVNRSITSSRSGNSMSKFISVRSLCPSVPIEPAESILIQIGVPIEI